MTRHVSFQIRYGSSVKHSHILVVSKNSLFLIRWLVLSILISSCYGAAVNRRRHRIQQDRGCDQDEQNKMQSDFQKCIDIQTQIHHVSTGAAVTLEEHQNFTCRMVDKTVECGNIWLRCHTENEVRTMKDMHILARISQLQNNKDGVDVEKCVSVAEFRQSGRGNKIDQTTEGSCTNIQVNNIRRDFQECSHNFSSSVWNELKELGEKKLAKNFLAPETSETNDIETEEKILDKEKLDLETETKPRLCKTLDLIGSECVEVITDCFSSDDTDQMRNQHVQQMARYYSSIYDNVSLDDCPALIKYNNNEYAYDDTYEDYDEDYEDSEMLDENDDLAEQYDLQRDSKVGDSNATLGNMFVGESHAFTEANFKVSSSQPLMTIKTMTTPKTVTITTLKTTTLSTAITTIMKTTITTTMKTTTTMRKMDFSDDDEHPVADTQRFTPDDSMKNYVVPSFGTIRVKSMSILIMLCLSFVVAATLLMV